MTLFVIPPPPPPPAQPPSLAISKPLVLNADTSRGTAKTLLGELVKPIGTVAPHFGPVGRGQWQWLNPDTSAGIPKVIRGETVKPVFVAAHFVQPQHGRLEWLPQDTTEGSFRALIKELVLPSGTVAPHHVQPQHGRLEWLPANTSAGMPKTLLRELVLPLNVSPWFSPSAKAVAGWLPADTTRSTAKTLYADATRAFIPAPHFAPAWRAALPAETSRGVLQSDGLKPIFVAPKFQPDWRPALPADSSQGRLQADGQRPFTGPLPGAPEPLRSVVDTGKSSVVHLLAVVFPPGNQVQIGPATGQWRSLAETSQAAYAAINAPPVVVVPPPAVVPDSAGSPRHRWDRKRTYLEIDGVLHEVTSREQALALLRQVRERVKKELPPASKKAAVVADVVMPALPDIKLLGGENSLTALLQPKVERLALELRAIRARSELAQLAIAKSMAEQDDEEVLMLLGAL